MQSVMVMIMEQLVSFQAINTQYDILRCYLDTIFHSEVYAPPVPSIRGGGVGTTPTSC